MQYRVMVIVQQMEEPYDTVERFEHTVDWNELNKAKRVAENLAKSDDF